MATAVGATLYELECSGGRLRRYSVLAWKTALLVLRSRADVVFFQNPSIVLAMLITSLKFLRLMPALAIGDFHNAGLFPPAAGFLVPWIVRRCTLIIVSNEHLETRVKSYGTQCLSIPDPLPTLAVSEAQRRHEGSRFHVFFVCSWARDEPISEVLRAAKILEGTIPEVLITVSGRASLAKTGWSEEVPKNVKLAGFLADDQFESKLKESDVVMDLTTRSDCMVCGAYESVSAETPMIVSDNAPMREYFTKGALFTDNSATDIAGRISESMAKHAELKSEVLELKMEILRKQERRLAELKGALLRIAAD